MASKRKAASTSEIGFVAKSYPIRETAPGFEAQKSELVAIGFVFSKSSVLSAASVPQNETADGFVFSPSSSAQAKVASKRKAASTSEIGFGAKSHPIRETAPGFEA